jgi:sarcosine oxidase subunit delta
MKIMQCPLNGPRNMQEFAWGGELVEMPDPDNCSDEQWAGYVFLENNFKGVIREWWCHLPTNYWFIAERDTASDTILCTYPAERVFKTPGEAAESAG